MPIAAIAQRKLLERLLLPQTSHHLVRGSRDLMPIAAIAQRKLLERLLLPQTSHHRVRGSRDLMPIAAIAERSLPLVHRTVRTSRQRTPAFVLGL